MDKNFFKFDIDDAVQLNDSKELEMSEKLQNTIKNIKKDDFNKVFCVKTAKYNSVSIGMYEKNKGLDAQRKLNQNPCKVDDYLNFDFKAKNKFLKEDTSNIDEFISDAEVEEIIKKTQIGVIFY